MQVNEYKPLIVAFCCNWCSYAGADLAATGAPMPVPTLREITDLITLPTLK